MVLLAAEHTSVWLWVLLEIASFGTFVSFLKLGYFAFLRPGDTKASDPPRLMQAGMLGAAALCILIGVYPSALYAILPYPTTYLAYDPGHVASALLVLGAAAMFFFTIGLKILEPHDTRLKDFDVLYVRAAQGITVFAAELQEVFIIIFDYAKDCARMLYGAGRIAMGMEGRDVNWNLAMFGSVLVALMFIVILGAGI
jgi:multicomponent Na+:H+ antiporter subunit D